MSTSQKLLQGLKQLGFLENASSDLEENLELSENSLTEKLDKYINEIILFNSAYNLTNTSDYDEIVVNHILDSLSAANLIREFAEKLKNAENATKTEENATNATHTTNTNETKIKIADIGSGGGLPGIPLALVLPQFDFTLVERMEKRCAFLENEKAILGLKNVSVLKAEAERIPQESFDLVTFRAFRPLDKKMTKTLLSIAKKGGKIAAYKAKLENIKEEMNGIKNLVPDYKVFPLAVPFLENHERNLVVFEKS